MVRSLVIGFKPKIAGRSLPLTLILIAVKTMVFINTWLILNQASNGVNQIWRQKAEVSISIKS